MTPPKWSVDYAITVTLPSKARKHVAEVQHSMYTPKYIQILRDCRHSSIVELTSNYDVHYHGFVRVNLNQARARDPLKYIRDLFRNDFGFICVKQVDNHAGWLEYCLKDKKNTSFVILSPIVKDHFDYFDPPQEKIDLNEYEPDILG